jgi:hypothetical protein
MTFMEDKTFKAGNSLIPVFVVGILLATWGFICNVTPEARNFCPPISRLSDPLLAILFLIAMGIGLVAVLIVDPRAIIRADKMEFLIGKNQIQGCVPFDNISSVKLISWVLLSTLEIKLIDSYRSDTFYNGGKTWYTGNANLKKGEDTFIILPMYPASQMLSELKSKIPDKITS